MSVTKEDKRRDIYIMMNSMISQFHKGGMITSELEALTLYNKNMDAFHPSAGYNRLKSAFELTNRINEIRKANGFSLLKIPLDGDLYDDEE